MRSRGSLLPWIMIGSVVRLALAPFTSHPFDMAAWITLQDRFFNAGINPLANSKYSAILNDLLQSTFLPAGLTHLSLSVPMILAQQFWIKLPFIAADVGIAILLKRFVEAVSGEARLGQLAGILWLMNPASLFFTSVHGQLDAVPALLLLAGLVYSQRGEFPMVICCMFLAGVAKYVGFIVLPVVWFWLPLARRPPRFRVIAVALIALLLAFPTVFIPWLRADLLGGVSSSTIASDYVSPWSVWALGRVPGHLAGVLWPAFFATLYLSLLAVVREAGAKRMGDPVPLLASLVALLAVLIALDPVANPQFVVWLLPLIIALACVRRSVLLVSLSLAAVCLNLLSLWMVLGFRVWFYNAVPDINLLPIRLDPSLAVHNPAAATTVGFLYAVTLLAIAVCALVTGLRASETSAGRSQILWRGAVALQVVTGVVVSATFLALAFQPSLTSKYLRAPAYPPGIDAQNTFQASSITSDPERPNVLLAQWTARDQAFLSDRLDRVTLKVTTQDPLPPTLERTGESQPIPIGRRGVGIEIHLRSPAEGLRFRVLLLSDRSGGEGRSPPPSVGVEAMGRPIRAETVVESPGALPGWYVVRVDLLEPVVAGRYRLDLRAPRSDGWSWGGGGRVGHGLSTYVAGRPSATAPWFRFWGIRIGDWSQGQQTLAPTLDDRLELTARLAPGTDLLHVPVALPAKMADAGHPSVALVLDVTSDPWWRERPGFAAMVALVSVGIVTGYVLLVRWGFAWASKGSGRWWR